MDSPIGNTHQNRATVHSCLIGSAILAAALFGQLLFTSNAAAEKGQSGIELLLAITLDTKAAAPSRLQQVRNADLDRAEAAWPLFGFLKAEILLAEGQKAEARSHYRALVEWSRSNPYGDEWGGSSLAGVALWRWMRLLGEMENCPPDEVEAFMKALPQLLNARLVGNLFGPNILGSLPAMGKEIALQAPRLALRCGKTEEALRFLSEEINNDRLPSVEETELGMINQAIRAGMVSQDRVSLCLGRLRQRNRDYDSAASLFQDAVRSGDPGIRHQAGLALAEIKTSQMRSVKDLEEIDRMLGTIAQEAGESAAGQEALYRGAMLHRLKGPGKSLQLFRERLSSLADRHPSGPFTDDALYQLAKDCEDNNDFENALRYFKRLRDFKGKNDWGNYAAYLPALMLYTRNQSNDRVEAERILQDFVEKQPFAQLYFTSLFWLGRIAEESGSQTKAESYFNKIIQEGPYTYYGIRASMHKRLGARASGELWPDAATRDDLSNSYRLTSTGNPRQDSNPYYARLMEAVGNGVYSNLLSEKGHMRKTFPDKRIEDLPLDSLDRERLLTPLALLFTLREDVMAAKDSLFTPGNRLSLAEAVESKAGDWSLAIKLLTATDEPVKSRAEAQKDVRFLSIAYPRIYYENIRKSSREYNVKPELLYAIMRNESLFDPDALSSARALGLFQFIPSTFKALDAKWKLLQTSGAKSDKAYLLDPELNIALGARWFREELLDRNADYIPFGVMAHNAGGPAVRRWNGRWKSQGRSRDLEYMLETVPYTETRIFAKNVLTDMSIAYSVGIFRDN